MTREPQASDLLWVDLETSGLHEDKDLLLEVGFVLTGGDLVEAARASWVLPWPFERLQRVRRQVNQIVRDMHEANGLWAECSLSEAWIPFRRRRMLTEIGTWAAEHAPTATLAGSSVGQFDVHWLNWWLPEVLAGRTHRVLDVSSIGEDLRRWAPHVVESRPPARKAHRALPDIEDSIAELRHYRLQAGWCGPDSPLAPLCPVCLGAGFIEIGEASGEFGPCPSPTCPHTEGATP
jgi:oligoribonuclease